MPFRSGRVQPDHPAVNPRDQHAWQLANELTWRVWTATAAWITGSDAPVFRERARESARLIAASVARGFERDEGNQRLRFFAVALSAADDTRAHLAQAVECGILPAADYDLLLDLVRRTSVAIRVRLAAEREAARTEAHREALTPPAPPESVTTPPVAQPRETELPTESYVAATPLLRTT